MSLASEGSPHSTCWRGIAATAISMRHHGRGIPCQDAAGVGTIDRPYALVADGRGSSLVSQIGAEGAMRQFPVHLQALEAEIARALDDVGMAAEARESQWREVAEKMSRLMIDHQALLADRDGRPPKDYEFTLAACVIGATAAGWMMVGDSVLVVLKSVAGLAHVPATPPYANMTEFLGQRLDFARQLFSGVIPIRDLRGIAAMSDGMSHHLIDWSRGVPVEGVRQLWRAAAGNLSDQQLGKILEAPRWAQIHDDDRAIALLVRRAAENDNAAQLRSAPPDNQQDL